MIRNRAMSVKTGAIAKIFWSHIKPYSGLAFGLLASVFAAEVIAIFIPIFYKRLFDALAGLGDVPVFAADAPLIKILLIIMALHIGVWIFDRLARLINAYFQPSVMAGLERTGFGYLLDHSHRFFANNFSGSLVRKIRRLSRAYEDISDNIEWNFFPFLITLAGSIIVIAGRSRTIAAVILAWIIFFMAVNYAVAHWKLKYDERRAAKDSEVAGVLADAISNNANIQLFVNQEHERRIFHKVSQEWRRLLTLTWNMGGLNEALHWGLMIVIEFVVMYLAIKEWGAGRLTIGDFALLQGYLVSFFASIRHFGHLVRKTYESLADAKEMAAILLTPHEIADRPGAKPLLVKNGAIELRAVSFNYRPARAILKNFNLKIAPREKVALVGPSGSGKTTIVQLLFRFHDVAKGQILIDGQNIASCALDSLRSQIALVPQDTVLFHRPLKENIAYGRLGASDADIIIAAKKARCHEFIKGLSQGYETFVGERGIKLSGGERQRVAIARAILKNAPILVLDEATSSLDSESEKLIQEALAELMRDKTTIVIAHRLSTILKMDRIVVIDKGEIVDEGTHQKLIRKHGLYKKLWQIQSSGFIE